MAFYTAGNHSWRNIPVALKIHFAGQSVKPPDCVNRLQLRYTKPVIRQNLIKAAVPSPEQIFDLIVHTENHTKIVWTAGRVLKEAALWRQVEELDYEERKIVLKRVTGILKEFALQGHLQRRSEPQSIGYGNEIGFDYVSQKAL